MALPIAAILAAAQVAKGIYDSKKAKDKAQEEAFEPINMPPPERLPVSPGAGAASNMMQPMQVPQRSAPPQPSQDGGLLGALGSALPSSSIGGMTLQGSTPPIAAGAAGKKTFSDRLSDLLPIILGGASLIMAKKGGNLTDAVAGFGKGFAQGKLDQALDKRKRKHEQENWMISEAHKSIEDLTGINFETIKDKLPPQAIQSLQTLMQKHREALASDSDQGGLISPKEAMEILALSGPVKSALAAAKGAQEQEDQKRAAVGKRQGETAALAESLMGAGQVPMSGPVEPNQAMGAGMRAPEQFMGQGDAYAMSPPPGARQQQLALANRKASQMMAERDILDQPVMVDGVAMPRRTAGTMMNTGMRQEGQAERQKIAIQWARESLDKRLGASRDKFNASEYNDILATIPEFVSQHTIYNGEPPSREQLDTYIGVILENANRLPRQGMGGSTIPGPRPPEAMKPPPIPSGTVQQGDPDQIAATFFRANPNMKSYEVTVGNETYKYEKRPNGKFGRTRIK